MRWKKNKNVCGIRFTNMVDISRKTYEKKDIEIIEDSNGILWLNEKRLKEGLDHKTLQEITTKCHSYHRKYRDELVDEPKKTMQWNFCRRKITNESTYGLYKNIGS